MLSKRATGYKVRNFRIDSLEVGPLAANCYIVSSLKTKEACLIDPGGEPERIKKVLDKNGLVLNFIINTHGHGDHILANGNFNVPIFIHELDGAYLGDPEKNLSGMFGFSFTSPAAAGLLKDGGRIGLGDLEFEVIHTPGHTPGSISLKLGDAVFTGDTLFASGIGRTDLPGGNEKDIFRSIKERLLALDDGTEVYPGHGPVSTIGEEKRNNPFF